MGLGQVEDLLHGLAGAEPEQPARADRDLPLDRLEPDRRPRGPRARNAVEPRAPVGLEEREQRDGDRADARDERQLAQRQPGRDEQRGQREGDHERRAEVGLRGDQDDRRGARQDHRARDPAQVAAQLRLGREHGGRVQHERQLHDLGRLELQRAGAQPAPRPVDLDADPGQQHQQEQHEGDEQQQRRRAADVLEPVAREQLHQGEAERPVDEVLDEVGRAVALALEQRPGGRRGVDHHGARRPAGRTWRSGAVGARAAAAWAWAFMALSTRRPGRLPVPPPAP